MTGVDHLRLLAELQEAFLEDARTADLQAPVPSCGRWLVRDLIVHLARVHHWAAAQARRTNETPLGRGPFEAVGLYERCAADLRATLSELDPDARAWALVDDGVPRAEHTGTVRFWHRRQALETLVHLWDLRTALGRPPGVDEPRVWLDCADEVLTVMHPRQVRLGRVPPANVRVVFAPEDADAELVLEGGPAAGSPTGGGTARVSGPVSALALLLWGRADLTQVRLDGDPAAVQEVPGLLATGLTP